MQAALYLNDCRTETRGKRHVPIKEAFGIRADNGHTRACCNIADGLLPRTASVTVLLCKA